MQSSLPVKRVRLNREDGPASQIYPAEVHFSVIVTSDFSDEAALQRVLADRCVTQPLRTGGVSQGNRYRAFNVSVMVPSRDELDRLDRDLRGVRDVKLLL